RPARADDPANALAQAMGRLTSEQRAACLLQIEGQLSPGESTEITESGVAANPDQLSEIDTLYRRWSATDPGRPGEWVRRKVQAYAAQQTAERALKANAKAKASSTSEASTPRATAVSAAQIDAASGKPWLVPVA